MNGLAVLLSVRNIHIFQGDRLVSSVKLACGQQASVALDYRQTVLTALQDAENALVSYHADQARMQSALDLVALRRLAAAGKSIRTSCYRSSTCSGRRRR